MLGNMVEEEKNQRQSNFELLRIVAMLVIVMHHFSVHGGFPIGSGNIFHDWFLQLFGIGGGVEVFAILSGYFLIYGKFKLHKFVRLVAACRFYGIASVGIAFALHIVPNEALIVKALLPFGQLNWFAYAYIVLYLLVPFLNLFIKGLTRKQFLIFLLLGFTTWMVIPTVANIFEYFSVDMQYSSLIRLIYFYCMGAYFRMHDCKVSKKQLALLLLLVLLSYWACNNVLLVLNKHFEYFKNDPWYFRSPQSIFVVRSILLFLFFKNLKISYTPAINTIASVTFGIYLIHDNDIVRPILWNNILRVHRFYQSDHLAFHAVVSVLMVFVVCGLIDYIRKKVIEGTLFEKMTPQIDKLEEYSKGRIDTFCNYVIEKL